MLDLEEEFDPVALGLVEAGGDDEPSEPASLPMLLLLTASSSSDQDPALEEESHPISNERPHAPASRSSSSRIISGYHSADWVPPALINGDRVPKIKSPSPEENYSPIDKSEDVKQTEAASEELPDDPGAKYEGLPVQNGDLSNDMTFSVEPLPDEDPQKYPNGIPSPSLLSTTHATGIEHSALPARSPHIRLVRIRRLGRRASRLGIRIVRLNPLPDTTLALEPVTSNVSQDVSILPEPLPGFQPDFQDHFGIDALEMLTSAAKLRSTSGQHLPIQIRELFPTLSDSAAALGIANALRDEHNLPHLASVKSNRVALRRAIAQMREKLYVELVSALALPSAPTAPDTDDERDEPSEEKPKLSMTPTNLSILARTLPKALPHDKATIHVFLADDHHSVFGEKDGRVVWQGGMGKMIGGDGVGFREKNLSDGLVHVFVDH